MNFEQLSTFDKIKELIRVKNNLIKALEECEPYSAAKFHPGSDYLHVLEDRIQLEMLNLGKQNYYETVK